MCLVSAFVRPLVCQFVCVCPRGGCGCSVPGVFGCVALWVGVVIQGVLHVCVCVCVCVCLRARVALVVVGAVVVVCVCASLCVCLFMCVC